MAESILIHDREVSPDLLVRPPARPDDPAAERKLLGRFQSRIGPNRVGPRPPPADRRRCKLLSKEQFTPDDRVPWMMAIAPAISVTTAVATLAVIPFGPYGAWGGGFGLYGIDVSIGLLYFFAFGSLAFYGLVLGGWSSGSKYSFLGAMRAAAQLISYEVAIGLSLLGVAMTAGSLSLVDIVESQDAIWFIVPAVRRLLHLPGGGLRGDGPRAVRPAGGRRRDRRRLQHRVRRDALRLVLHGRVHRGPRSSPAIAAACFLAAGTAPARGARAALDAAQDLLGASSSSGPRDAAAPALRPADVVRLEVPAAAGDPERARDRDRLVAD